ncbi:MAG: ATP-binding cassette domain-containing protein, partial [Bacteroidales bacterium]
MIECKEIIKSYGDLRVLKGINLSISEGEIVSIVGVSGAGKSTLLQIMGSLLYPDSGEVIINGVNIFSLSSNKLSVFRNRKIGFVFQFHHLLPE